MRTRTLQLACLTLFAALAACSSATTAPPTGQAGDGATTIDDASSGDALDEDASDEGGESDAGATETSAMDSGATDSGAMDSVTMDSGATDTASPDTATADGASDAPASCTDCTLLKDDLTADGFVLVVAGGRVLWDRDIFKPLQSITTSGTDLRSHGTTGCGVTHRDPVVHGDYLYYLERMSSGTRKQLSRLKISDPLAPCEKVFEAKVSINGYALDATGNALFVSHRPDTSSTATLGKLDLTTLSMSTVGLSHIRPAVVAGGQLFGYTNLALGGLTYNFVRASTTDGATTDLVKNIGVPEALATDATHVYYEEGDKLYKVPRAATGVVTPTHVPGPSGVMLADGDHIVWYTYGESTISRMPLAGGAITTRSVAPYKIIRVAWDATRYYVMANPGFSQKLVSLPR